MLLRAKLPSAADLQQSSTQVDDRQQQSSLSLSERRQRRVSATAATSSMASAQQMPPIMLGLRVDTGSTEQLRPKQAQMDNRWQQQPPQKPPRKFHYQSVQQLIASPMLSNYHRDHSSSTTSNNNISNHHNNHNNHTQQPQTAATSSTLSTHSPVSFSSPQSASSPNQQMQQQQHGRPLRIAQPPPLSSSSSNGSAAFPSMAPSHSTTSFPSASVGHRAAPHLHSSISVPTMHHHQKYQQTGTGSNGRPLGWSVVSHSALGERFGQMSYEQLLELARNQQRQIETNVVELDERQRDAALFSVAKHTASSESEQQQNANMLMATIRAQIERDERELAQLGQCQEEARQLREHNQNEGRQLRQLEAEYQNGETQLRRTVQMVDSLRSQLEVLYQRRAAAADAAIARQRQINGVGKPLGERRPKASISPFKKSESSADRDETDSFSKPMPSSMAEDQAQPEASTSSTAAAGVVHWRTEAPPHHEHQPMPAHQYEQYQSGCLLPPAVDKISLRRNSLNQAKRNSLVSEFGASGEDHILAMLLAEQRRGRSHISFGRSWDGQLEAGLGGDGERGSIVANAKASLGLLESMNRAAEQKEQQQKAAVADLARTRRAMTSKVSPTKEPTLMRSRINDEEDQMKKKAEEEKTKGGRQIHEQEQQQPQSTASAVRQKAAKFQAAIVAPPVTTQNSSQMLPQKQSKQTQQSLPQHQTHLVVQLPPKTLSPVKRAALPSAESLDAFNENFTKLAPTCEAEEEFAKQDEDEKKKSPAKKEEVKVKVEWEVPSEEEKNHQPTEEDWKRAEELERKDEEANGQKDDVEEEEEESVEDVEEKEEAEVMLLDKIDLNANNGQNWAPKGDEEGATSCEATAPSQLTPHSPPEADSPTLSATDSSSTVESEKSHSLECLLDGSWQPQPSGSGQLVGTKGILRRKQIAQENSGRKKRVNFDVVVLFLDVAYEGHYETFVELASKIPDISVANSEGITALHYAICAGSQDIVRFLVDHGADVNALDVDGWSPLHCAASCDNLPMLRMLVENGACPLATTISKSETAAQIFDECSDYAAGVEYMNFLEHCMGQVNAGKVYAAYSYEAQHEDELNFEEGDELKVLKKSEKPAEEEEEEEKKTQENGHETEEDEDGQHEQQTKVAANQLWWLCEHTQREGQRGLVPRNYLAIFPSWKHRDRYQLNFQLPHQLNNGDGDGTSSVDSPAADENSPAAEESGASRKMAGNAVISVQHNGKPLGHQELSTYA